MKINNGAERKSNMSLMHRLSAVILCLIIAFSVCYTAIIFPVHAQASSNAAQGTTQPITQELPQPEETRADIKARLIRQIYYEDWDPYSSDMTLEEFYALMELFDEGVLPVKGPSTISYASVSAVSDDNVYIPRSMFMFGGLSGAELTGPSQNPLEYPIPDEENADEDEVKAYPNGLDPYGMGYMRPPMNWDGIAVNDEYRAVVIVKDTNDGNPSISGDVDQTLFLEYTNYYVRRVTAQNTEATILGAVKLAGQDEYVYYYLTNDLQSSEVSTTTLPKGQKFIVEYCPIEHIVEYEVYMDTLDSTAVTNEKVTANVNGTDITDTWENIIFGTDHPLKTDAGAYSFTAYAPYGYTVEFYLDKAEDDLGPILALGKDEKGSYNTVNGGWALGKEPIYVSRGGDSFTLTTDTANGPDALTMSGTFYNDNVHHDRTVIAVVTANSAPIFNAASIIDYSSGTADRGTSAIHTITAKDRTTGDEVTIPYDYEDVFLWVNGGNSKYDYSQHGTGDKWAGSDASYGNLKAGNVPTGDGWMWKGKQSKDNLGAYIQNGITYQTMDKQDDGTYNWQWTFQTNSASGGFIMDALQINGVSFRIPFLPKDCVGNFVDGKATGVGLRSWYSEGTLPDGAYARVEMLYGFTGSTPQRVYRIIVTGARSNVTVTGMNMMMGTGAKEFVVYDLEGITGATARGSSVAEAIQYYNKANSWGDEDSTQDNVTESNLVVDEGNPGLNFVGDLADRHGANIRFKLADGYDSPYFLWENARGGTVIAGQASIERFPDGSINYDSMNPLKSLSDLEPDDIMDSQHIYKGENGWYYIRVTTQDPHKIALLTIIARPVRYVVRYVPTADTNKSGTVGVVSNPENMPIFEHDSNSHDSFLWDTENGVNGWEYDDAGGAYYDTAIDDIVRLPAAVPYDPDSYYRFVDWVLVDADFNPIWASTEAFGESIQVVTDGNGNRLLTDSDGYLAVLTEDNTLESSDVRAHWNSGNHILLDDSGNVVEPPENWVLLTRGGKLAYADGTEVEMHDETDWGALLDGWFVQDVNGDSVTIASCNEFHYRSNHITLADINQYAIANEKLGGNQTDIYVLRLMPVWEPIDNPFHYNVALNWVDAQGNVYQEYFDDYWREVLTDWKIENGNYLTVQVIKDAVPFLNWIAMHPTYTFWDDVNNAAAAPDVYYDPDYDNKLNEDPDYDPIKDIDSPFYDARCDESSDAYDKYYDPRQDPWSPYYGLADDEIPKNNTVVTAENKIAAALDSYAPDSIDRNGELYKSVYRAMLQDDKDGSNTGDDFARLGNYAYYVREDSGTIVVWMYEDKGGLVFRKEIDNEPLEIDDQFYFTVSQVTVGDDDQMLNGTYKAYPEHTGRFEEVKDKNGNTLLDNNGNPIIQEITLDSDAWLVTFEEGKIHHIVKNGTTTVLGSHFTLRDFEGIRLYVPAGKYTIIELGSRSGGAYKVEVEYDGDKLSSAQSGWDLPTGNNLWLRGNSNVYIPPTFPNHSFNPDLPEGPDNPREYPNPDYLDRVVNRKTNAQVSATVDFDVGEKEVVHTLIFHNKTTSLSIQKEVTGQLLKGASETPEEYQQRLDAFNRKLDEYKSSAVFEFDVILTLPSGHTPLVKDGSSPAQYYFNLHTYTYDETGYIHSMVNGEIRLQPYVPNGSTNPPENKWIGTISLKHNQRAVIVTEVLNGNDNTINYEVTETNTDQYNHNPYLLTVLGDPWSGTIGPGEDGSKAITAINWFGDPPGNGYLCITEEGGQPGETFIYKITDNSTHEELIVTVTIGEDGKGETYVYVPAGEYTVEEITDWAWRYKDGVCDQSKDTPKGNKVTVVVHGGYTKDDPMHADYTNERNNKAWLGGEKNLDNRFVQPSSAANAQEYALLNTNDGDKKKRPDDEV